MVPALAEVAEADTNDVDLAVTAAMKAVERWRKTPGYERGGMLANDVMYGLAASVWTSDVKCAHRIASEVHAGTVEVNTCLQISPASPFGGYKRI
jgi:acyl-CoA reductase-like NAD-dependent aldehyde dehydrogenase